MTASSKRRGLMWAAAALVLAVALAVYQHLDVSSLLTLDSLKTSRDGSTTQYRQHPIASLAFFFAVYVAVTALSLPGATILTLAAEANKQAGLWKRAHAAERLLTWVARLHEWERG
ncbi:MAG TPA: hypothetical protein VEZ89_04315 [Rubrivivax sp.]|nr:hypothetical protein [Rubrivivax sp.]